MAVTDKQINIIKHLNKNTLRRHQKNGFLTKDQAALHLLHSGKVVTHSTRINEVTYYFFSDDHLYGYINEKNKLNFVPTSSYLPQRVTPRKGLVDGHVNTLDEYISVFFPEGDILLETFNDLIRFTDKHNLCLIEDGENK